jgi:hypothetical protein
MIVRLLDDPRPGFPFGLSCPPKSRALVAAAVTSPTTRRAEEQESSEGN